MGNYQPVAVDRHAFKAPAMLSQDPRFLDDHPRRRHFTGLRTS